MLIIQFCPDGLGKSWGNTILNTQFTFSNLYALPNSLVIFSLPLKYCKSVFKSLEIALRVFTFWLLFPMLI